MATQPSAPSWTPGDHGEFDALVGKTVYSADGAKLGTVQSVFHPEQGQAPIATDHYLLVDPGLLRELFSGSDVVSIPQTFVASVSSDRVTLSLTKEQVRHHVWSDIPEVVRHRA